MKEWPRAIWSKVGECSNRLAGSLVDAAPDTLQLRLDQRAAIEEDRYRPRSAMSTSCFKTDDKSGPSNVVSLVNEVYRALLLQSMFAGDIANMCSTHV